MTGDPYDRTRAPKAPAAPTFSPLRPVRLALWWWLSTPMIAGLGWGLGTAAGCILAYAAYAIAIDARLGSEPMPAVAVWLAALVAFHAPRLWLRAALHLDDPAAREVWERRLTR